MTTSEAIQRFKRVAVENLIASDDLIDSMANLDIVENNEAVYKYIFPYFYIPYIVESAHSYICMRATMPKVNEKNDFFGDFYLIVWVIVHQDIMKMDGVGGATRMDYLAGLVEQQLVGNRSFGTKELQIISNEETDIDSRHRARVLTFMTSDLRKAVEC